jgi:predicted ATPase/DNA-binding CsgD family transcriptional regulator
VGRARLVTVVGPGGVGKTRVALELARKRLARHADGTWIVDLTVAEGTHDVGSEVARVLDVRGRAGAKPTDALRSSLAERDLLLILDNCEHVIDGCAELARTLLTSTDRLRIVATSREPMGIDGERVWPLEPLGAEDANRLFVQRASQRRPGFVPSPDDDDAIAALCSRVDCLPLAIELAAARTGAMSLREILADLETRLGDLGGGRRGSPTRHATVRAAVAWSFQLLEPDEQRALRELSVFAVGFDAAAAAAIAPGLSPDRLARLVDKSLVSVSHSPGGRTRYRLLETVRQHAGEQLSDAGELDAARDRHLAHFSKLADAEPDGWPSTSAQRLVSELGDDYENLRAALEWGIASDPCATRAPFSAARDLFLMLGQADGRRIAEALLHHCPRRDRGRAEIAITAGLLAMMTVDPDAAKSALTDARELSIELGDRALQGWAAFFRGLTDTLAREFDSARACLEEARSLHREAGSAIGDGAATAALGLGAAMTGDPDAGTDLLEQALSIQASTGWGWGLGQAHLYLAIVGASGGDHERVSEHARAAVEALRPYRDSSLLPVALVAQASTLVRRDAALALRVAAAAFAIRARIGGGFAPVFSDLADRVLAKAKAAVGRESERVAAEGVRLTTDDAIALAFGEEPRRAAPAGGLSARELEVCELVADGLSNKEIAARLQLSVRTVESHVRHALTKLGLANRTQLASWLRGRIR